MRAGWRWVVVAGAVVLLATTPVLVHVVPVSVREVPAAALLHRIRASTGTPFSGYAESVGTVQLPVADRFEGTAGLLGERNRLRVWWRGDDDWRVAVLRTTGETSLFHDLLGTTRWSYESGEATRTPDAPVRLPDVSDVVPTVLARRVLSGARSAELRVLPARRVAGRDALGLRLHPAGGAATVDHADVYADADTGLPLSVALYATGERLPFLRSGYRDVWFARPDPATTRFSPPPGTRLRRDEVVDIAAAADRFAHLVPPRTLAGLALREHRPAGAAGLYGRGPTVLVAVPLWNSAAHSLRSQLASSSVAVAGPGGTSLAAGPLDLLLARPHGGYSWLLAGTVTTAALTRAATRLSHGPVRGR